jgi:hypothetical protein
MEANYTHFDAVVGEATGETGSNLFDTDLSVSCCILENDWCIPITHDTLVSIRNYLNSVSCSW